jgi:transaldolase
VLAQFAEAGVDMNALGAQLQDERARSFVKSWKEVMSVIDSETPGLEKAAG